jgi:hypothetical protein
MSVDLGPLKAGLYEAAHRAGVCPSVLARKAIAASLGSTASESAVEVSQPRPGVTVDRGPKDLEHSIRSMLERSIEANVDLHVGQRTALHP